MDRIPIAGPWITDKEVEYVAEAARSAWYERAGEFNARFETAFAEYLELGHAIALNSGTAAIHLALAVVGVGPGDEVIVPEATWIASSAPATYLGASPVFADIDAKTWCLDPGSFEELIGPRTKAVVAVDLYGNVAALDVIGEIAERRGVALVEDAAEALGSTLHGRKAGAFGQVGIFSFHGSKTMTTGEGGMIVMDDPALHRRAQILRDHGRHPEEYKRFWNHEIAFKYKMSAVQAALGLAQLERIDELVARKQEIFSWYEAELAGLEGVTLNEPGPGVESSYWMTTAVIEPDLGVTKETVIDRMAPKGIDVRPFFYPLSSLPAYADLPEAQRARKRNRAAYDVSARAVNLPSALCITRDQVARVCAEFAAVLADAS